MDQKAAFTVGNIPIYGDLILAPMAGYSDHPYRMICRRMGSAMSYTEFVSIQGLFRGNWRTMQLLHFEPPERPIVFQVFGRSPDHTLQVCLQLEKLEPDIIDINMGCPVTHISGRGDGAGLLREPSMVEQLISTLTTRLSIPVTAKIRLGWDSHSRNHVEIARLLEQSGAALIAVHGRTRADSYGVPADWDAIAEVKQAVSIPVLGNGDVKTPEDIDRIKVHTRCDGVMIGRGAIANPWIFQRRQRAQVPVTEQFDVIREHLARMVDFYGEHVGVLAFRKHVVQYIRGLPNASELRRRLMTHATQAQVIEELDRCLLADRNVL